jgi:hypothetical protein
MFVRFLIILLLSTVSSAHAQDDSITSALNIVEEFHAEAKNQIKDLWKNGGADAVSSLRKLSLESKERTVSDLKSLKWIEKPGTRRYKKIYDLVDSYTGFEIDSVGRLAARVSGVDRKRVAQVVKNLTALKKMKLDKLGESLAIETYERKKPQPVPVIDPSPFEKEMNKGEGIWYR